MHTTARAAVLRAPREFQLIDVAPREPARGQVLLRLQGCGICASNLPPWEGRPWFQYPMPPGNPGHEAWGIVEAVGHGVTSVRTGDRVAALSERAYATHDTTDADRVVVLPSELDNQPFPGEPLACAFNVLRRADVKPGQKVAIIGVGFMGAVLTALCKGVGAEVLAISRRASSLEVAASMGADRLVRMDQHDRIIDEVSRSTDGELCDVVIECVGEQWPLDLATALTRVRGRLVIAGYHQDGPRQVDMQMWNWRGLDVVNAHERDHAVYVRGMRDAVDAVRSGRLAPASLYTHVFPLERIGDAMDVASRRPEGFVKALLRYD